MTLIELVASLALFVIIFGSLLTITNTATSLWSSSRSQQHEQAIGQNILELLSDDLQHAVTDSVTPSMTNAPAAPTFILDSRTNQPASGVQIVLQFARHAKPQSRVNTPTGIPLSVDAVFYTLVDNALFRHVIPLAYTSFADAEPLGELLDAQRANIDNKALHTDILGYVKDPDPEHHTQPTADWSYALLAERIDILALPAALPEAFAIKSKSHQSAPAQMTAAGIPQPPEYDYLSTDVLPDHIEIALRLHSEESWAILQRLQNDTSDEANTQRQVLGLRFSKRITFPAQGGSRLP
jgi:hypothetical protein